MSITNFCDICRQPIKPNDKKYTFLSQELVEIDKSGKNEIEIIHEYMKQKQEAKVEEICVSCKKVYDYVFKKLRLEQVNKIKKELESMEPKQLKSVKKKRKNQKKYCNCKHPERLDEGFLREGVCNGICYVCGKPFEDFKLREEE